MQTANLSTTLNSSHYLLLKSHQSLIDGHTTTAQYDCSLIVACRYYCDSTKQNDNSI